MPKTVDYTRAASQELWNAIPGDEPVFVLRAQDLLAPLAVTHWAVLVMAARGRCAGFDAKVDGASHCAEQMRAWPMRKLPD